MCSMKILMDLWRRGKTRECAAILIFTNPDTQTRVKQLWVNANWQWKWGTCSQMKRGTSSTGSECLTFEGIHSGLWLMGDWKGWMWSFGKLSAENNVDWNILSRGCCNYDDNYYYLSNETSFKALMHGEYVSVIQTLECYSLKKKRKKNGHILMLPGQISSQRLSHKN